MATWPSWRYGPDGQAKICNSEDDVPQGWIDRPAGIRASDVEGSSKESGSKPKRTLRDRLKGV